jgi:hypothetical protein
LKDLSMNYRLLATSLFTALCAAFITSLAIAQTDLARSAGLTDDEKARFKGDANRCENFDTVKNCEAKRKAQQRASKQGAAPPLTSNTSSAAASSYGFTPQVVEKITVLGDSENRFSQDANPLDRFAQAATRGIDANEFGYIESVNIYGQRTQCRKDTVFNGNACATSGLRPNWIVSSR